MIFVGDIAVPDRYYSELLDKQLLNNHTVFEGKQVICNFEGLINDSDMKNFSTPVLFNHSSVVDILSKHNFKVVGLANNHTLDIPMSYNFTKENLLKNSIFHSGAGYSVEDSKKPAHFFYKSKEIYYFNYCWDVLLQHQKNPAFGLYVNTINEKDILRCINRIRTIHPEAKIITSFHWNFDLEILPFPAYRKFARALIDNGTDLVIGTHSHCVQGAETYQNKYIVYGLGNFFVPWFTFINSSLRFPEFAKVELAFECDFLNNDAKVHFFKYDPNNNHSIKLMESESFSRSFLIKEYSPYQGMNDNEYLQYFKKHRRKKFLLPIYYDYKHTFRNKIKDSFIISRIKFARLLAKYNLHSWNN